MKRNSSLPRVPRAEAVCLNLPLEPLRACRSRSMGCASPGFLLSPGKGLLLVLVHQEPLISAPPAGCLPPRASRRGSAFPSCAFSVFTELVSFMVEAAALEGPARRWDGRGGAGGAPSPREPSRRTLPAGRRWGGPLFPHLHNPPFPLFSPYSFHIGVRDLDSSTWNCSRPQDPLVSALRVHVNDLS